MNVPAQPKSLGLAQGIFAYVGGAFVFSLATVFVKFVSGAPYHINPGQTSFMRFAIGFAAVGLYCWNRGENLRPEKLHIVLWRGAMNAIAIMLLYTAVEHTTVTNANILNLTYPAWILLTSPIINRERAPLVNLVWLALTLGGAFLITMPEAGPAAYFAGGFNLGDLAALGSSIAAAFGISLLREARKTESTMIVIFYMFLAGMVITLVPTMFSWRTPPDFWSWFCLVAAALCGLAGQIMITFGYRYVSASQGSLLSSSGVLISAVLGTIFFADPLHWSVLAGGLLVLVSLIGVSGIFRQKKKAAGT